MRREACCACCPDTCASSSARRALVPGPSDVPEARGDFGDTRRTWLARRQQADPSVEQRAEVFELRINGPVGAQGHVCFGRQLVQRLPGRALVEHDRQRRVGDASRPDVTLRSPLREYVGRRTTFDEQQRRRVGERVSKALAVGTVAKRGVDERAAAGGRLPRGAPAELRVSEAVERGTVGRVAGPLLRPDAGQALTGQVRAQVPKP